MTKIKIYKFNFLLKADKSNNICNFLFLTKTFKMSDAQSTQFRNKSISQLVEQLNNLGDTHVAIQPTTLIGIIDKQSQIIRRFRSRSMHKSGVRSHDSSYSIDKNGKKGLQSSKVNMNGLMQFFLSEGSQKKYYYNDIVNQLEIPSIGNIMNKFSQGFNTTIIMEYRHQRFQQILIKIQPWLNINSDKSFYASFIDFKAKEAMDLLSGKNQRTMSLSQGGQKQQLWYQSTVDQLIRLKNLSQNSIKILKINKKSENFAELRVVLFPQQFLITGADDPCLKIVKSQLSQIINYIKTNPNKKYENINKLLPKRYPTTTAIAQILLYDSANYVVNWVADLSTNKNLVNGRFDFYDKLANISNLIKIVDKSSHKKNIVKSKKSVSVSRASRVEKIPFSQTDIPKLGFGDTKPMLQRTEAKTINQLQYCRSLQRKTHKYSLAQFEQSDNDKLFPQTTIAHQQLAPQLNQSEAITILKAQHARQISQYHQTIQNLNQKLLVLTSEKGLSDIFTIHERQIMLLQLKIDELRKDISKICSKQSKQKETQNLKEIIKKLNEQISSHQKNNPSYKLSQGKIKMLEHELTQWKQKYQKSQIARKQLKLQLEASVNRLKIKDQQTQKLYETNQKTYKSQDLSSKELKTLSQLQSLLSTTSNSLSKDNGKYIVRKFKNILGQVSQLREIILQCHNFLVDLQDHIQSRLSQKDPDVVLDCNRFIRTYLLNNMDIF